MISIYTHCQQNHCFHIFSACNHSNQTLLVEFTVNATTQNEAFGAIKASKYYAKQNQQALTLNMFKSAKTPLHNLFKISHFWLNFNPKTLLEWSTIPYEQLLTKPLWFSCLKMAKTAYNPTILSTSPSTVTSKWWAII